MSKNSEVWKRFRVRTDRKFVCGGVGIGCNSLAVWLNDELGFQKTGEERPAFIDSEHKRAAPLNSRFGDRLPDLIATSTACGLTRCVV